jgi:arylsulfatase A-like enzyme
MTGRYPWRGWKKNGVLANWERPMIEDGRLTLPALLQKAGYATAGFGKWHLGATYKTTDGKPPTGVGLFKSEGTGSNIDLAAPIAGGPTDHGFERWYGFVCASEMLVFDQDRATALLSHDLYAPPAVPGADKLPKVTVADFLPRITDMSVAYLKDRAANAAGKPFFLYYAPYVPHAPLAVGQDFRGRTKAGDYGDYVHQLDHEVGRLLKTLDDTALAKETLVLFASDNGSEFPLTGEGHRPNGELRGRKHTIYEGGVRTPLIARWPGQVPAGAVSAELVALNDLLATTAAIVDEALPAGAGEDSRTALPVLLGKKLDGPVRAEVVVQASARRHAICRGKWKFIQGQGANAPAELYDLEADPGESRNLIAERAELADELRGRLREILQGK